MLVPTPNRSQRISTSSIILRSFSLTIILHFSLNYWFKLALSISVWSLFKFLFFFLDSLRTRLIKASTNHGVKLNGRRQGRKPYRKLIKTISRHWSLSTHFGNIWKPIIFWCFQGAWKKPSNTKWTKKNLKIKESY